MIIPPSLRRWLRVSVIAWTVLLSAVYLLSCLTPYISPARFKLMGYLGLAFPVLLLIMVLLCIAWSFRRKRIGLVLLLLIAVGHRNIGSMLAFNSGGPFQQQKPAGSVRVLCWNVRSFDTHEYYLDTPNSIRHQMMRYIQQQDADILCLQDFLEYHHPALPSNIGYLTDSLHYPYHYFTADYKEYPPWGPSYSGVAIFSKVPISRIEQVTYPGKRIPESIIVADIEINKTKRRFVVTHLQSFHLKGQKPFEKEPWSNKEDSAIIYSGNPITKLDHFLPYHAQQSEVVKKVIGDSPYPVIFSADMNETPTTYAYHNIRGGLNDIHQLKGFGLGRTYYAISPTLRIDHIFLSKGIEVMQYKKDDIFMSDHYPQVMDLRW